MTIPSTAVRQGHLWIKDITEKESVRSAYLVRKKKLGTTKNGKPFLSLTLADRTGEVEGRVWNRAQEFSSLFDQGDIIEVSGAIETYKDQIQLIISGLSPFTKEIDPAIFMESSPRDPSEMAASLRGILKGVKDVHLRAMIDRFLGDRGFLSLFKRAPAAKNFHHNYLSGLLEHTLSVCRMALQVAEQYPQLNRELLVTAAFLHDIGKTKELKYDLAIDYTDQGRLLGHIVMGVSMVDEKLRELRNFPENLAVRLKHLILSHHGQFEFGSPKRPKFLEAFALHLIDDLDAKINGLGRLMERDRQEGAWTGFSRLFERYLLKGEIIPPETESTERTREDEQQASLFS